MGPVDDENDEDAREMREANRWYEEFLAAGPAEYFAHQAQRRAFFLRGRGWTTEDNGRTWKSPRTGRVWHAIEAEDVQKAHEWYGDDVPEE